MRRESLEFQQIIWTSVVHAHMNNSDAQEGCALVLNLSGTGCKNSCDRKHQNKWELLQVACTLPTLMRAHAFLVCYSRCPIEE